MMSIEEARRVMGPGASVYTDAEMRELLGVGKAVARCAVSALREPQRLERLSRTIQPTTATAAP